MLEVSAVVLANLCVCYIMTSEYNFEFAYCCNSTFFADSNEEAEEVMKRVEREENARPERKSFHLSIIISLSIFLLYILSILFAQFGDWHFILCQGQL
jgi:hypothetical protein